MYVGVILSDKGLSYKIVDMTHFGLNATNPRAGIIRLMQIKCRQARFLFQGRDILDDVELYMSVIEPFSNINYSSASR